jgi:putative glycosyltransferase (TIGR04372 family)
VNREPLPPFIERISLGKRPLFVSTPHSAAFGHQALEIFQTARLAADAGAAVVYVRENDAPNPALYELEPDGVPVYSGLRRRVLLAATAPARRRRRAAATRRVVLYDEIKRRVDDLTQPIEVRRGFKRYRTALNQSAPGRTSYYRRRLLQDLPGFALRPEVGREAAEILRRLGVADDARIACIHSREPGFKRGHEVEDKGGARLDSVRNASIASYDAAIQRLADEGLTIVRLGDSTMQPLVHENVIDLATSPQRTPAVDIACLLRAEIVISGESGPAAAAMLGDAAILTVNATDVISSYPIVESGFLLLKTVRDRRSGTLLTPSDMLREEYFARVRDAAVFTYEDNTPEEIHAALDEVLAWRRGAAETERQLRFRDEATEAATRLAERYSFAFKWGADRGFLGRGRVVDVQLAGST